MKGWVQLDDTGLSYGIESEQNFLTKFRYLKIQIYTEN